MNEELRIAWIPADLHKWLKRLAVENDSTVQEEHAKALREAYRERMLAANAQQPAQSARASA